MPIARKGLSWGWNSELLGEGSIPAWLPSNPCEHEACHSTDSQAALCEFVI